MAWAPSSLEVNARIKCLSAKYNIYNCKSLSLHEVDGTIVLSPIFSFSLSLALFIFLFILSSPRVNLWFPICLRLLPDLFQNIINLWIYLKFIASFTIRFYGRHFIHFFDGLTYSHWRWKIDNFFFVYSSNSGTEMNSFTIRKFLMIVIHWNRGRKHQIAIGWIE